MADWMTAVEASALAEALRGSVWAYPIVNALHIFGVALLVGSIVPLDLRLLGLWPKTSLATLWAVLTRTAATGFGLAIIGGLLLFITRVTEYADSGLFAVKMAVVGGAAANALISHWLMVHDDRRDMEGSRPSVAIRITAGVSVTVWIAALVLGRLVGYF